MTHPRVAKATAILVYTALRLGLFLLVWLSIELLSPLSGVWAIVVAILVSGVISVVVLDRPRQRVAGVADGFFSGINARIDASARAEDDDDEEPWSGDGEQRPEDEAEEEK